MMRLLLMSSLIVATSCAAVQARADAFLKERVLVAEARLDEQVALSEAIAQGMVDDAWARLDEQVEHGQRRVLLAQADTSFRDAGVGAVHTPDAPVIRDEHRVTTEQKKVDDALPSSRDGDTLVAIAAVIAAVLRGFVWLLKQPFLSGIWNKFPLIAQWLTLGIITACLAAFDSMATGVPWKTAIATALAGYFASWTSQKLQKTDRKVNAVATSIMTPTPNPGTKLAGSLVVLLLLGFSSSASAQMLEPRRVMDTSSVANAVGNFDRNAGWCDDATMTATNIWASSEIPAELKAPDGLQNRMWIRYLAIQIVDKADTDIPVCVRLGPNVGAPRVPLVCDGTPGQEKTNGSILPSRLSGRQWHIEKIALAANPEIYVLASAPGTGAGVRYCVEASWHQKG